MRLSASELQALGFAPDGTRLSAAPSPTTAAARREADLHAEILAHCRARRWPVVHSRMDCPQTAGIGTPDFVVAITHGITVWIEAKAVTGKLTTPQAAWLAALRANGHRAEVVRSLAEFIAVVDSALASKNPISGTDSL